MATKSSIHIKPCNIASSEAHNRRTAEYMRNIGESRIYVIPELSTDNEQWINPDFGTPELRTHYDNIKRMVKEQVSLAEQELKQVKAEIRTDKLKKTATNAATAIASGVGSLFGSGKLKELECANESLRYEISNRDKSIDELKAKMQLMKEQHGKQIRNIQGIHNQELEAKDKEILRLNTILEKALCWFPLLKEMLRMEKLCYAIGFTKGMVDSLLYKREVIRCSGKIYSEEYRRRFEIKNDIFKIEKSSVDENKLVLTINRQPIGEWFKEQWEKLRHGLRQSAEEPRKSRGFRM